MLKWEKWVNRLLRLFIRPLTLERLAQDFSYWYFATRSKRKAYYLTLKHCRP